jgi:hypothetical protein
MPKARPSAVEAEMAAEEQPVIKAFCFVHVDSGGAIGSRYATIELTIQGNRVLDRSSISFPEPQQFALPNWLDTVETHASEVIDGTA